MRAHSFNGMVLRLAASALLSCLAAFHGMGAETVTVRASGFTLSGAEAGSGDEKIQFKLAEPVVIKPFVQACIKQDPMPASYGPAPEIPYFNVRFAMPIPPENGTNLDAAAAGLDPNVFTHNHSPGFEILPNGDALAVYFSTPPGKSEDDPATTFIQARLRHGSEDWDVPELFLKTEGQNDQSGLLWNDGGTIRFFGGGRGLSDLVPFKMATSTDNGSTWTLSLPQLDAPAEEFTAQPITSAFLGAGGTMYFAMDGKGATSFLWRSQDGGVHWHDMGGRTGARHSAIVPVDDHGGLLSIGGKNAAINGWSPENHSTNWGASWSEAKESPFPPLGSAQRPSLIKLADGNLFFVSDSYLHKKEKAPPAGWKYGDDCIAAISTNNGSSWRVKPLPVQLPNHGYRKFGTLGYVTARQARNGVIHVLTTETQPCLHYELNEAWLFSDVGDVSPESGGGVVKKFSEQFANGKIRSRWSARICPHGRYLLDGEETDYYDSGSRQHQVVYINGRKTGEETFWTQAGVKVWNWTHDNQNNTATWVQYWPNGKKKFVSTWNTKPEARDLKRSFFGLVANGPSTQWSENGELARTGEFKNGLYAGNGAAPSNGGSSSQ